MPLPANKSPFLTDQYLFQCSLRKNQLMKKKHKEHKFRPHNFTSTIEFPNYRSLEEEGFYKLISEGKEAVVNFSKGDGYKASTYHTYLKVLSSEHGEAEFYHLDTGRDHQLKRKLGIHTDPTLVVIVENEVRDIITGFKDFKTKLVVKLAALKARLASSGVIRYGGIIPEKPQEIDDVFVEKTSKAKLWRIRKRLEEII